LLFPVIAWLESMTQVAIISDSNTALKQLFYLRQCCDSWLESFYEVSKAHLKQQFVWAEHENKNKKDEWIIWLVHANKWFVSVIWTTSPQ